MSRAQARRRHLRLWGLASMLCTFMGMALLFGGAIAHDAHQHTLQVVCWMSSFAMGFLSLAALIAATD